VSTFWLVLGFAGQAAFSGRFIVQWLASEREGRSVVPVTFWLLSIVGSMILLAYAVHRRDPVFVLGQATGVFIYLRNLHLIRREARGAGARGVDVGRGVAR
jgi:lipid-A-disaccharide synthase-like uncharacterized protein